MTKCLVISLAYVAIVAILIFVIFNEVTKDKNDE